MGECAQVKCKYYIILYKGLVHPWILIFIEGHREPIPFEYPGTTVNRELQFREIVVDYGNT